MADPYRSAQVRSAARVELAESDRPPTRAIRVRAWSDGTTRLHVGPGAPAWQRYGLVTATIIVLCGLRLPEPWCRVLGLPLFVGAGYCLWRASRMFGSERIEVTPAAVLLRLRSGESRVLPLADVSTVVVSGRGASARLDLQCNRERIALAEGLGYDDASLRWIAQRLRRALEAAR